MTYPSARQEPQKRSADDRELLTVEPPNPTSASLDELRSLLNPPLAENVPRSRVSNATLAILVIVELAAIIFQSRWVPTVRMQVQQRAQSFQAAITSSLGMPASDQHDVPENGKHIAPTLRTAEKETGREKGETEAPGATPNGTAAAEYELGLRYAAGAGVPQDESVAAEWFKKAANRGHRAAQRALSEMYLGGRGVPKDVVRAYTWARIAARGGNQSAPEVQSIGSQMTASQISDAERRIAVWRESQPTAQP
jgi:TPR repeat protein